MLNIFFSENRAAYEIMSKNMVEPERPQMAIWRRVACWIIKATRAQAHASARAPTPIHTLAQARMHAHTQKYVRYCFSTAKMISRTRLSVTLCVLFLNKFSLIIYRAQRVNVIIAASFSSVESIRRLQALRKNHLSVFLF